MKQYAQLAVSLTLLGLLSACASKVQPTDAQDRYYVLTATKDTQSTQTKDKNKGNVTRLMPIFIPAYLDQPGLVLKESEHRVLIAQNHLWAESLRSATQRALLSDLNQANANTTYVFNCEGCDELMISIDHFYPTTSGEVELMGYFTFSRETQARRQSFALSTPLEENGYEHAVMKMRNLLMQLAADIASVSLKAD